MKKSLALTLIIVVFVSTAFAQPAIQLSNSILTGKVVEHTSKEPLPLANIILFKTNDSSQVSGATTYKDGVFQFSDLPNGEYYLQVSYIGFAPLKTKSFILKNAKLDLGALEIKVSPIVLGNIEVTAEKAMFNNAIDRKVYNVEKDIVSQTGSASDLLQNIPSVSVDVNGNISLRGTANVTFFINGKPSLLMRKNSAAALQQMAAFFQLIPCPRAGRIVEIPHARQKIGVIGHWKVRHGVAPVFENCLVSGLEFVKHGFIVPGQARPKCVVMRPFNHGNGIDLDVAQ